ncbi:MAG: hypothetical protein JW876_01685 [Candidatus Krumholzibacteriota bacterium]|nr:hypothetical protein [Candidatus Krumholzibacteriota bacterium]
MEPVIERSFTVDMPREELLRLLGRRPETAGAPGRRLEAALDEAIEEAGRLVETAGIWTILPGSALEHPPFAGLERMAVCVCSIGPRLEDRVAELTAGDELLRAVVLDAAGSTAAEAAAGHMDRTIAAVAAETGLGTSCRASPGYGDWPVEGQAALFRVLPAGRIGVRLSSGGMMIPRKSVSFAMHVARDPARLRSENSCENCDRDDCPGRSENGGKAR